MKALKKSAGLLVQEALSRIDTVAADQVADQVAAGELTVLDVREPDEWAVGHIPGAVHIPRGWLELKADPSTRHADGRIGADKALLVYCDAGKRSALATATLKAMGYERVLNLGGGFRAWEGAGYSVERGLEGADGQLIRRPGAQGR